MNQKYGLIDTMPDSRMMNKQEMKKLIEKQENGEMSEGGRAVRAVTPIDRESEMIWRDRTNRTNEKVRHENLLKGKIGDFSFDLDIQKTNEARFMDNLNRRRQHVMQNAKDAK